MGGSRGVKTREKAQDGEMERWKTSRDDEGMKEHNVQMMRKRKREKEGIKEKE